MLQVDKWTFPAGERGVRVELGYHGSMGFQVRLNFKNSDSIIDMLLTVDAIRREYGSVPITLYAPYFPYARQDRKMQAGESHSLKVIADLVNSCKFTEVKVVDPHSNVLEALVDNLVIVPQFEAAEAVLDSETFSPRTYDYLIAPDAGAMKKIYKLSERYEVPVICAHKKREVSTGKITHTTLTPEDFQKLSGGDKRVLVVDDICDGGATFINLAVALPSDCKKDLYVTHGIFSKGKVELYQHYENILCYNDMSI